MMDVNDKQSISIGFGNTVLSDYLTHYTSFRNTAIPSS
jgi:hypothetical protein